MFISTKNISISILMMGILISLFLVWDVLAASSADIKFPVAELNNCKSETDCRAFCDKPENAKPCLSFARKYNLLPEDELKKAEKLAEVKNGPGGCNSQKSCESFCDDIDNVDECLSFAEKNGLMDQGQLEEAKKVQGAIKRGAKLPGGCGDKKSCESYCGNPDNADECLAFAEDAGIISQEELGEAKKILPLMKRGETPGACKSKGACEAYCEDESHAEECVSFAEKAGFISKEEAEIVKKTGGRGPGGCRGRACKVFCEDPANQETCFEFAKENGLIKEVDLQRMQQGRDFIKRDLGKAPPEIKECIEAVLGPGGLDKLEAGKPFGSRDIGEKMKSCFEKSIPPGFGQFKENGEFSGPGGCKSFEECSSYCQSDPKNEQCQKSAPPGTETGFKGPGGCSSMEECTAYCQANPEECKGFKSPSGFPGVPGGYNMPYFGPTGSPSGGGKCSRGWNQEINTKTNRSYCAITQEQCDIEQPGTVLSVDNMGYKVCWLPGASQWPEGKPIPESFKTSRGSMPEEFKPPEGIKIPEGFKPPERLKLPEGFKPSEGFTPPAGFRAPSPEDLQKYQQQIPPEYQQQYQKYQEQYQQQYQQP
ncbi:MAG: hypothetical protein HZB99_01370 [Candidatus Harrisonbacteria bacterium]|nr:hypothetical protein [Candidatus Harrisonbacteria bacterium]